MNKVLERLNMEAAQKQIPLNATFELTSNCNMNCRMCYIHRQGMNSPDNYKPLDFWLSVAEQAKKEGTLVVVVTGGETFLYPHAEELIEKLLGMGFVISLNTNGTLLDDRRIVWLNENRPAKINISLYGASDKTYETLCGCKDGFTRVSRAVDSLLANGHNVYLNGTCVPENVDDIPEMYNFAKARGLDLHNTSYIFPAGRYGIHSISDRLSPVEAARADLLMERLQIGEKGLIQRSIKQLELFDNANSGRINACGGFHSGDGCSRSNCGGGRNSMAITYDGRMLPCVTNSGISVSLKNKTLHEAWEELKLKAAETCYPEECIKCEYQVLCNACPATVFNETGSYDKVSEYTCAVIKEKFHERLNILLEKGVLKADVRQTDM
ncbi:MAG: radical SAM protein [Lachnospiraceae bacterium]|nr:radical SAM protein [Lachnospiraceae bacterium]